MHIRDYSNSESLTSRSFLIRLVMAAILVNLFVMALVGISLYKIRQQYESHTAFSTQNLARSLATYVSGLFDKIDVSLLSASKEAERQYAGSGIRKDALNRYLKLYQAQIPELDAIRISDARGDVLYGSGLPAGKPINIADRDFFRALQDNPKAVVVISKPVIGRITGKWVIFIARRVSRPDGSFGGVVYGVIMLEYFDKLFSTFEVGPHGAIAIRDLDLSIVVLYPKAPGKGSQVGSREVTQQSLDMVRANPVSGTFTNVYKRDNIERTRTYYRIGRYPLYMIVGQATSDYLAPWYRQLWITIGLMAFFLLSSISTVWQLSRRRIRDKQAAEAISLSEERFRTLFENAPDAIVVYDVDLSRITTANAYAEALFGCSRQELVRADLRCFYSTEQPDQRALDETFTENYEQALDGKQLRFERAIRTADGRDLLCEVTLVRLPAENRRLLRASFIDITERKHAEKDLADSERRFRTLIEQAAVGVAQIDPLSGRFLQVNGRYCDIVGLSLDEMLKTDFQSITHPDDLEADLRNMNSLIAGEINEFSMDKRFIKKDGCIVWVHLTVYPTWFSGESPTQHIAIIEDITKRKRAEETLAEMLQFETLLAELSSRFVEVSPQGLDSEIMAAQRNICELLDLELSSIYQPSSEAAPGLQLTHLYRRQEGPPIPAVLIAQDSFPWCEQQLLSGKIVIVNSIQELPAEAVCDQNSWRHFGIKSSLMFPLLDRGSKLLGTISFDTTLKERSWTTELVKRLQLVAQIFANSLSRKKAEDKLRESERKYRELVENANSIILRWTRDGHIVFMNEFGLRFFGYTEDEIIGRQMIGTIVQETETSGRDLQKLVDQIFANPNAFEQNVNENIRRNGERVWIAWTNKAVLDQQGQVKEFMSIGSDITKHRREELFTQIRLRLTNLSYEALDMETFMRTVLDEAETLTESQIGFFHFVDDDQNTISLEAWSTNTLETLCTAQGKGSHYPVAQAGVWADGIRNREPFICNDYLSLANRRGLPPGHAPVTRLICLPIKRNNLVVAAIGVGNKPTNYTEQDLEILSRLAEDAFDITLRKRAELSLRESEARFRTLTDHALVGIDIVQDNRFIYVNPAFAEIFGYQPDELIGANPLIVIHPDDQAMMAEHMKRRISGEEPALNYEFRGRSKNGEIKHIEMFSVQVSLSGRPAIVANSLDSTERRKLEAQLRHAQKMEAVGTLAGGIAHDFNNILNVIIGYGTMLMERLGDDSISKEQLNEVLAAADRAANLTKRLLVFSRKQVVETKSLNVNEIIAGMEKMLRRIVEEDISINLELPSRKMIVMADAGQLEQVLMNLASNAKYSMKKGGKLTISAEIKEIDNEYVAAHGYGKQGTYALISVRDTGSGMDAETQKKIFEPFFTTKGVGEGTGLGLSIVYGIIKQHNGYIDVYSEPGKGTEFKIYLPLVEDETTTGKEVEAGDQIKGGTETILIAEDDASIRKLTRIIFESFGYTVITAEDGDDAINKYMENRDKIRLLLFDMIMPKKSGKEAYEEIRKISPDVKSLFLSGYTMDVISRKELLEEGMDYILKPVSQKDLLNKVREVLDK